MNVAARLLHISWLPTFGGLLVISILYACGDGPAPMATSEGTTTPVPAVIPTQTPTHTPAETSVPIQDATPTPTTPPTATPTQESTPSPTREPTVTPTQESTPSPTREPTATPTQESTPSPTREPTATSAPTSTVGRPEVTPSPSPDIELAGEAGWTLESLDGRPLIEESSIILKMSEDGFVGFDGCNHYDGRSKDGAPIADADGRFSVQDGFRTEQHCPEPQGIMEQADAYISALWQGERFRIVDDRLEILDSEGATRLVFVKQEPLPGHPVELEGTGWRLLIEADAMDGVRAPTLAFLDDRLVTGATACRSYVATYKASEGALRFPIKSMVRFPQSCGKDARILEGEFGDFLTWAREYSVHEEGGSTRLRIRSARGKTLTFEQLPQNIEGIADTEWSLVAFVELRQLGPGMWNRRTISVVQGTEVTILFDKDGLGGFTGCNSYAGSAKVEDGSISIDAQNFSYTAKLCEAPDGLREQEERYFDLVQRMTRYGIYGDGLFMQTDDDVFLLFQAE